jgi:hypothetical protein
MRERHGSRAWLVDIRHSGHHTQTNNVKDLSRSGRPRVISDRDDRALQRLVRRMSFATSPYSNNKTNRRLSTKTVRNCLKSAGLKSRRVIKRPLLADRHRRTRFGMVFSTTWLEFKDMAQDPLAVEPNAAMPCRHDQILPMVCQILASLSHCWFVCVFSPVGWLQYSGVWKQQDLTVLVDRRLLGSQCCLITGMDANGIRLTKRCNALLSRSDVTRGLSVSMVRRRISEAQRWQIIGNNLKGASFKENRLMTTARDALRTTSIYFSIS